LVTLSEGIIDGIRVFPNPTDNKIHIVSANNSSCSILSPEGKIVAVFEITGSEFEYSVDYLVPGIYWFQFRSEKGFETCKVIIK